MQGLGAVDELQLGERHDAVPVERGLEREYGMAPYLIASRVHLNPVWVMFAIAAFGYLFGFVGLLIAVPLAAAIGVVSRFAMRQYLVSQLEPTAVVGAPEPSGKKTGFWRRWREKT